jgi:hypothetical protein
MSTFLVVGEVGFSQCLLFLAMLDVFQSSHSPYAVR